MVVDGGRGAPVLSLCVHVRIWRPEGCTRKTGWAGSAGQHAQRRRDLTCCCAAAVSAGGKQEGAPRHASCQASSISNEHAQLAADLRWYMSGETKEEVE